MISFSFRILISHFSFRIFLFSFNFSLIFIRYFHFFSKKWSPYKNIIFEMMWRDAMRFSLFPLFVQPLIHYISIGWLNRKNRWVQFDSHSASIFFLTIDFNFFGTYRLITHFCNVNTRYIQKKDKLILIFQFKLLLKNFFFGNFSKLVQKSYTRIFIILQILC